MYETTDDIPNWNGKADKAQRERIATAAMAAILSRRPENDHFAHITAKLAVDYADALIEELNKEQ